MSIPYIRAALEKRLALMSPPISTAYENVSFTSVTSTPYQKANLLRATPDNSELGSRQFTEIGIFQVMLCWPQNAGAGPAELRAQAVRDWFKRGLQLTESGITTNITRTPNVRPALIDGDRYCIPIDISWQAFVPTP